MARKEARKRRQVDGSLSWYDSSPNASPQTYPDQQLLCAITYGQR